jgi:hypothetical protein
MNAEERLKKLKTRLEAFLAVAKMYQELPQNPYNVEATEMWLAGIKEGFRRSAQIINAHIIEDNLYNSIQDTDEKKEKTYANS